MKEESPPPEEERRVPTHTVEEWRKPLVDYMAGERTAGELVLWLRTLLPELDSPLAGYVNLLKEMEDEVPEGHGAIQSLPREGGLEEKPTEVINWVGSPRWWRCSTTMPLWGNRNLDHLL